MKGKLHKIISLILALVLLSSLFGCAENKKEASLSRDEAFKDVVQRLVNQYGYMDSEKCEQVAYLDEKISGVLDAQKIDVTDDDKDELICVWYDGTDDNKQVGMSVYEYEKGKVKEVWHKDAMWTGIYSFSVMEEDDTVYWAYSESRHFVSDITTYKNGKYKNSSEIPFTKKEEDY